MADYYLAAEHSDDVAAESRRGMPPFALRLSVAMIGVVMCGCLTWTWIRSGQVTSAPVNQPNAHRADPDADINVLRLGERASGADGQAQNNALLEVSLKSEKVATCSCPPAEAIWQCMPEEKEAILNGTACEYFSEAQDSDSRKMRVARVAYQDCCRDIARRQAAGENIAAYVCEQGLKKAQEECKAAVQRRGVSAAICNAS